MKIAKIFTDGGARGNPGPAGIGVYIEFEGKKYHYKEYIGEATNNQAEYQGLVLGLEKAHKLGAENVEVFMDSELVVSQLNQKYRVKDKHLAKFFVRVWNISQNFKKITYSHIGRESNKIADRLVNDAIDQAKR